MFARKEQAPRAMKKVLCRCCTTGQSIDAANQSTDDHPGSAVQVLYTEQSIDAHSQSTDGQIESWAVD